MKLLPYDTFEIQSPLSLDQAVKNLQENVEPKKWLRTTLPWSKSDRAFFQGEVSREEFKISRIINYRNSFLPTILGSFGQSPVGVTVEVRMRLYPLVLVFMFLWFGGIITGLIAEATGMAGDKHSFPASLFLSGMLAFGFALTSIGFWAEAKKAKNKLLEIFQGQIRNPE